MVAVTGMTNTALGCGQCGRIHPAADLAWRCAGCGGVLDLVGFAPSIPARSVLRDRPPTLWRYAEALPVADPAGISLGEGMTPLVAAPGHPAVRLKVDYLMPTGSFKDRGAVLLAAMARRVLEQSFHLRGFDGLAGGEEN